MSETLAKILAVETSTYEGSIALAIGDQIENRSLAAEGRRNAQTMVAEIDRLLKEYQLKPSDIDAVAVSIGPGSFTGLRVGVVFAKTYSWTNKTHLIAVDTFQAVAQQIDSSEQRVTVISDAQRNELFINEYEWDQSKQIRQSAGKVRIETLATLVERSQDEVGLLTGPGLAKHFEELSERHRTSGQQYWQPKAATVVEVGQSGVAEKNFADKYTLEPLYIRRSYAEEAAANK